MGVRSESTASKSSLKVAVCGCFELDAASGIVAYSRTTRRRQKCSHPHIDNYLTIGYKQKMYGCRFAILPQLHHRAEIDHVILLGQYHSINEEIIRKTCSGSFYQT